MRLTGFEAVFFYAFGILALAMAIGVVTARSAVHSALALVSTLLALAGLYVLLGAEFLGGVQVLVYVGGVMVLFVFVIMLVNPREESSDARVFARQTGAAIAIVGVLSAAFFLALNLARPALEPVPRVEQDAKIAAGVDARTGLSSDTQNIGDALYRRAAFPFEVASVLLLVAIVGAVALAREPKQVKHFEN